MNERDLIDLMLEYEEIDHAAEALRQLADRHDLEYFRSAARALEEGSEWPCAGFALSVLAFKKKWQEFDTLAALDDLLARFQKTRDRQLLTRALDLLAG